MKIDINLSVFSDCYRSDNLFIDRIVEDISPVCPFRF